MTAAPSWSRGDRPSLEESAQANLAGDVAATRLHLGGTGRLPVDQDAARFELTEEQRANRGSRPKSRRWKALDRLDAEVDQLTQKQVEASARVQGAEQAFNDAPQADARSLADWIAGGERGARPDASLPERERELAAAQLLGEAVVMEIDRALERRLQFIEKNREKMISDARKDIDQARGALSSKVGELVPLREMLVDARANLLWAASYPAPVTPFGAPSNVAMGLREPVERHLSTRAQIAYTNLIAVLEADADALSSAFSDGQREALGDPVERTPLRTALWDDDVDMVKWKKAELERARQLGEFSPDLNRLAAEASDLRP